MCAITLDNCSTNDTVIKRIQDYFSYEMLFNREYNHIRRYAHILSIMV